MMMRRRLRRRRRRREEGQAGLSRQDGQKGQEEGAQKQQLRQALLFGEG